MKDFLSVFEAIRSKGLGLTLHIAEVGSIDEQRFNC